MAVYRIDLGYDGSGFRGWARNSGVRSVQGEIETALARVLGGPVALSVAGRTDAGVHARHQVASFSFAAVLEVEALVRSLRTMVGPEISIHRVTPVPDGFDARFSALRRSYRYFIDENPWHDPLQARWVWHRGETLDIDAMNRAAAAFIGEHDFAALCRASDSGGTERTVESAGWERKASSFQLPASSSPPPASRLPPDRDPGVGDRASGIGHPMSGVGSRESGVEGPAAGVLLVYSVSAKAFCHQMVRSMVALCVDVGRGRLAADAVPGILEGRDRNAARGVAPAHGLTLWGVDY